MQHSVSASHLPIISQKYISLQNRNNRNQMISATEELTPQNHYYCFDCWLANFSAVSTGQARFPKTELLGNVEVGHQAEKHNDN